MNYRRRRREGQQRLLALSNRPLYGDIRTYNLLIINDYIDKKLRQIQNPYGCSLGQNRRKIYIPPTPSLVLQTTNRKMAPFGLGAALSRVYATGLQQEEDAKTLECDKRDRVITCVFCRDLHLNKFFLVFYNKICLKEGEAWRKVFSYKIVVTPPVLLRKLIDFGGRGLCCSFVSCLKMQSCTKYSSHEN